LAIVRAKAEFKANAPNQFLACRVSDSVDGTANFDMDAGDVDGWYDQRQTYDWYQSVAAGSHTYTFHCATAGGGADADSFAGQIIVQFSPTQLG